MKPTDDAPPLDLFTAPSKVRRPQAVQLLQRTVETSCCRGEPGLAVLSRARGKSSPQTAETPFEKPPDKRLSWSSPSSDQELFSFFLFQPVASNCWCLLDRGARQNLVRITNKPWLSYLLMAWSLTPPLPGLFTLFFCTSTEFDIGDNADTFNAAKKDFTKALQRLCTAC